MRLSEPLSQYRSQIYDSQVPENIGISNDVAEWENYVIQLFQENDSRRIDDQIYPTGSVEHIWQVKLVAGEIIDTAVNCEDYDCSKSNAEIYALSHDIGRVHSHPLHPHIGPQMFSDSLRQKKQELVTANGNYNIVAGELDTLRKRRRFAAAHHFWGMGDPSMEFYSKVQSATNLDKNGHFESWNEDGINNLLERIDEEFGLPGIAANLADISKTYPDISTYEKAQQPKLNPVSRGAAELMIQRLVILRAMRKREVEDFDFLQNTTYEKLIEEDAEYAADRLGAEFALKLIQFATERYGINYEAAVENASRKWPEEKAKLDTLWNEHLSKKYAQV